ncbi:Lipase 3 [Fusarium oxysporum f. sp. albedinis]|nr:Lipase 3 [Fusarium oxysporum f. sp. albedinis]
MGMLDLGCFPGPLTASPPPFSIQQFHRWRVRVAFIIVSNLVKETDGFITRPHLLVTTSILNKEMSTQF